jgi:hypothetical protein
MRQNCSGILALALGGLLATALGGGCCAQSEPLQTEIEGFFCTNEPVSHAICLLAKRSAIPINAVIDDVTDPMVTVSVQRATIGQILRNLLEQHPGHDPYEESGTVLILPGWLFHKEVFPLTKKVSRFSFPYQSYKMRGETKYGCFFYLPENPALNIGFSPMRLNRKPNYSAFPYVRTFTNQSPLEILTTVSQEAKQSFYCYRLDNDFVKARNKEWADKKMGPTWWPNPDAPCYSVFWGTDWPGIRPKTD